MQYMFSIVVKKQVFFKKIHENNALIANNTIYIKRYAGASQLK
jgi:hypothetical protein